MFAELKHSIVLVPRDTLLGRILRQYALLSARALVRAALLALPAPPASLSLPASLSYAAGIQKSREQESM